MIVDGGRPRRSSDLSPSDKPRAPRRRSIGAGTLNRSTNTLDPQQIELIGRNLLVGELLRDRLEVARPERDRGIDLIAYLDMDEAGGAFVAVPIQLKAFTRAGFSIDRKYERFPGLLIAYLWGVMEASQLEAFCLTYREAMGVGDKMGWTGTESWRRGSYVTNQPSAKLRTQLEPYRMAPGRWADKARELASTKS